MTSRAAHVSLLVILAGLCSSCASVPATDSGADAVEESIESILSKPLPAAEYDQTQRCLGQHDYRDFSALDEKRILFEGRGGELWLNTLHGRCPELRHANVLRVRSNFTLGRLCEMDRFEATDWFYRPWYRRWPWNGASGMTCTLGKFQRITHEQVLAIEAALEGR